MRVLVSLVRPIALSVGVIAFMTLSHGSARADEVTLAGYTNGCFNCAPAAVPNIIGTQTAPLLGLSYTNSQFNDTTFFGNLGFGGNPTPTGIQNVNNFGSFTLANSTGVYAGNAFTLRVTFNLPTGISGGSSQLYTATLLGAVSSTGTGGVNIDFNNTPQVFTFSNANGSGSFTLTIHDVAINPGQTASLDAFITSAQQTTLPEPTGMILLGTGLIGVVALVRRIKRN